jgi:shikimate kinase
LKKENSLVALGGGTPCSDRNIEMVNKNGTSIYLETDIRTLLNRLNSQQSKRPLIRGMTAEALSAFIKEKLEERKKFYDQATLKINTSGLKEEDVLKKLQLYLGTLNL